MLTIPPRAATKLQLLKTICRALGRIVTFSEVEEVITSPVRVQNWSDVVAVLLSPVWVPLTLEWMSE